MFHGVWFECAPGSTFVEGTLVQPQAPTTEHVDAWLQLLAKNEKVKNDVLHRFMLTKRNCRTFRNWAKRTWFFRNATTAQIDKCAILVGMTS